MAVVKLYIYKKEKEKEEVWQELTGSIGIMLSGYVRWGREWHRTKRDGYSKQLTSSWWSIVTSQL